MLKALCHAAEGFTALVAGKNNFRVLMIKALISFDRRPVSSLVFIGRHREQVSDFHFFFLQMEKNRNIPVVNIVLEFIKESAAGKTELFWIS